MFNCLRVLRLLSSTTPEFPKVCVGARNHRTFTTSVPRYNVRSRHSEKDDTSHTTMASHSQMKAVQFEKPGPSSVLAVAEVPVGKPGPGQVLVRVHAAGLNRIEAMIRGGMIPIPPPVILGTDGSGIVEEVGSGESQFKKGDRVAIFGKHPAKVGTYAQYFVAESDMLFHLPERYTIEDGAALGIPFMTAYYNIVIQAAAKSGEVVLINGASGAVGLFGIEIAHALGCKVIGVAGHEESLALITKKGATAINYKDSDFVKKVKEAAGPKGVDVILETKSKNLPNDIEVLNKHGRITLIGDASKESIDFLPFLMKELTLKATTVFSASPEHYKLMKAGLEKALKDGSIQPVVQKIYAMGDVSKAHDDLVDGKRAVLGKLVLDLSCN